MGSLGTCVPCDETVGGCCPEATFLSPRAQARGLLRDAFPNEVRGDAVPSEARDARLALGRTKNGRSAGQGRGDFFKQPSIPLDIWHNETIFISAL
jgi:hypothetical protein